MDRMARLVLAAALIAVGAAMSCSSGTDATDGSSATDSNATDSSATDGAGANSCTSACLMPTCASEINACRGDSACVMAAQCANSCTTPICASNCNVTQNSAATAYFTCAFVNCNCFIGTAGQIW